MNLSEHHIMKISPYIIPFYLISSGRGREERRRREWYGEGGKKEKRKREGGKGREEEMEQRLEGHIGGPDSITSIILQTMQKNQSQPRIPEH